MSLRTLLTSAPAIAISALLLCAAPALARPILVRGSIQAAIDAADPGDTIVVLADLRALLEGSGRLGRAVNRLLDRSGRLDAD